MTNEQENSRGPLIRGFENGLSRRTFLWGAGATLALPWLEALRVPGFIKGAQAQTPMFTKRFLGFYTLRLQHE